MEVNESTIDSAAGPLRVSPHLLDELNHLPTISRNGNHSADNLNFLSESEQLSYFYTFTRNGFRDALRHGRLPDGSELIDIGNGRYMDRYRLIRNMHGPFWPIDYGPLYPAPVHVRQGDQEKTNKGDAKLFVCFIKLFSNQYIPFAF